METNREWPNVTWDYYDLENVARAVRMINEHVVFASDESAASYIRSVAERELYRANPEHGWLCRTGGWQVTFLRGDQPNHYTAWPSLTGYNVLRYAKKQQD